MKIFKNKSKYRFVDVNEINEIISSKITLLKQDMKGKEDSHMIKSVYDLLQDDNITKIGFYAANNVLIKTKDKKRKDY